MKANNCPFCGGKICRPDSDFKGSWVLCFGCLARGPRANTAEEAVEKWNTLGDQWVSVEDRLPGESGNYYTADNELYIGSNFFSVSKNDFYDYAGEITHWMPLPEPPKGVE